MDRHPTIDELGQVVCEHIIAHSSSLRWLGQGQSVKSVDLDWLYGDLFEPGSFDGAIYEARIYTSSGTFRGLYSISSKESLGLNGDDEGVDQGSAHKAAEVVFDFEVVDLLSKDAGEILGVALGLLVGSGSVVVREGSELQGLINSYGDKISPIVLDQTNSAFRVGDIAFGKYFRSVGTRPREARLYGLLADCDVVPRFYGEIFSKGGETVAIVTELLSEPRSLWDYLIESLTLELDETRRELLLSHIHGIGLALGKLHGRLDELARIDLSAHDEVYDLDDWARHRCRARGDVVSGRWASSLVGDEKISVPLFGIVDKSDLAKHRFEIHGDFHLGQVMLSGSDLKIIDFEGEPISDAGQVNHPLRDLGGALRSLSYAIEIARSQGDLLGDPNALLLELRRALVDGYAKSPFGAFIFEDIQSTYLTLFFEMEKALYELYYEKRFRQDYIGVPLSFLLALTSSLGGVEFKVGDDASEELVSNWLSELGNYDPKVAISDLYLLGGS